MDPAYVWTDVAGASEGAGMQVGGIRGVRGIGTLITIMALVGVACGGGDGEGEAARTALRPN